MSDGVDRLLGLLVAVLLVAMVVLLGVGLAGGFGKR